MHNLICIVCPRGCHITVHDDGSVTGNTCLRGKNYALNEISHPTRMITSSVKIEGGEIDRLPVHTSSPIPKDKIFDVMEEIHKASIQAPCKINDVVIENVLGLGVDILSSRNIQVK